MLCGIIICFWSLPLDTSLWTAVAVSYESLSPFSATMFSSSGGRKKSSGNQQRTDAATDRQHSLFSPNECIQVRSVFFPGSSDGQVVRFSDVDYVVQSGRSEQGVPSVTRLLVVFRTEDLQTESEPDGSES